METGLDSRVWSSESCTLQQLIGCYMSRDTVLQLSTYVCLITALVED